jgi:hypothetical protein
MNDKKQLIVIMLTVILISTVPIVTIDDVLLHMLQQKPVFAQISSSASSSSVHITKDTTNSYTISSGSSSIGTFDTTYTILGNINSIKSASNLIISTITKDYDSSPTIGYVKVSGQTTAEGETNSSSSQASTLVNPFADKATINQKINTEIQKAMESAMKSNFANVEIKCDFGMELSNWKCSSHGLLG